MKRSVQIGLVSGAVLLAAGAVGANAVGATGRDDREVPISGSALERASSAALAHTGGGRVTDTEVGDEESYYEVEVTLDDGSEVDVQLDENFTLVDVPEADDDGDETAGG